MITIAQAEPAILVSILKPVLLMLTFLPWAYVVSLLNKDAGYYYVKRELFSFAHIGSAILGLAMMLLIPIFWVGWPLAILVMSGSIFGYVYYRNPQVPAEARFTFSLDFARTFMTEREQRKTQAKASIKLMKRDETELPVPIGDDPNVDAHLLLEQICAWALPRKADEIGVAITGEEEFARLHTRIDGVKYGQADMQMEQIPKKVGYQLIKYLQETAGLDVEEKRKRQVGKFNIAGQVPDPHTGQNENQRHLVEVVSAGSSRLMSVTLEVDPDQRAHRPLTHLGMPKKQQKQLKSVLENPGKVILTVVPPKQGLSTLTYAILNEHDPYTESIITLERDVVIELEGVKHITVTPDAEAAEVNRQLGGLLRTDPQVLMVEELADQETARLIAESAQDVRFYQPLRGNSAMEGLKTWLKTVGDPRLAAESLGAIVSGRLVRIVCETCRTAYKPDAAQLKKMSLPADKISELYRSSGQLTDKNGKPMTCPVCHGLGYQGRTGIFEVMVIDDTARKLIAAGETERLKAHLAGQSFLPLQRSALLKVAEGLTDVAEVQRAMSSNRGRSS